MGNVVAEADFPHGLRCGRCDRPIEAGQPYERVLDSVLADERATPILLLVCVYCAGALPETEQDALREQVDRLRAEVSTLRCPHEATRTYPAVGVQDETTACDRCGYELGTDEDIDRQIALRAELDAELEGHDAHDREQRAAHPEFDAFKERALMDPEVRASYEAAEREGRDAHDREQRAAALAPIRALCDGADQDQVEDHPSLRMVFVKDVRAAVESS